MSANEQIADEIQAHSIDLERFSADLVSRILPILNRVERSLAADVAEIDPTGTERQTTRQARLKALLRQTRGTIATGYGEISETVRDDLHDVAKVSDKAGRNIVNKALGVEIMTVAIAPEQLRALADDTMIQGAVVKEHWSRQSEGLRQKFQDRVQEGFIRGESSTEIVNRVRGTKALGYSDGVMLGAKNNAGALVRTSVQAVANDARLEIFRKQRDVIGFLQHLSVLDNRVTIQCRARSMLMWDLDGNPVGHGISFNPPPIHYNCRSVLIPVLKPWGAVSDKLTEAVKAKSTKRQADETIEAMQASMGGPVSADLNYEDWLKTQSLEMQLEVLGPTKHKLWTDGKITFRDLVDQRGNPLTLAELIAKVESGQTTAARGETMRKAKEEAASVDDLERQAAAAEKDANQQLRRSQKAGYVSDEDRDLIRQYTASRIAGQEPDLDAIQAFDARPEWLQDRITRVIDTRRAALKAKEQAGPAAEYAKRKAIAESAQRLKKTLHDPEKVAEWIPGQMTDGELNGVPFAPWEPGENYNWLTSLGRKPRLPEPPIPQLPNKRTAAAILMVEPDARAWLYVPVMLLSGDAPEVPVPPIPPPTFPSGALEAGMDLQAIALREAWEETGLRAEILGHLSDIELPSSVTRYYVARRTGGAPWRMGWDAQSVRLVPLDALPAALATDADKRISLDLAAAFRKALLAGNGDLAAGFAALATAIDDLLTAAAKRKAALLKEWVTRTAKDQPPSAAAVAAYNSLTPDEKAAYAALAAARKAD